MPYTFQMKLKLPTVPTLPTAGMVERIRSRFALEAGQLIINAVRKHLGTNSVYDLSPEYARVKPKSKKFRRFPGKSTNQELILSGEMYNSLVWSMQGSTLSVQVEDGKATDGGYDYAELWEEVTNYLEIGFMDVESDLPDHLLDIIFQEMAL